MKCTRAGLICAGYDIKLRWSDPIQYIPTKTGNVKSQPIKFTNKDDEQLDENNNSKNNNNSSSEFSNDEKLDLLNGMNHMKLMKIWTWIYQYYTDQEKIL